VPQRIQPIYVHVHVGRRSQDVDPGRARGTDALPWKRPFSFAGTQVSRRSATLSTDIRIVSPDDHLVEPADLWTSRLPERYRDIGPHIVRTRGRMDPTVTTDGVFVEDDEGREADIWHYEDAVIPIPLISAAAGYEIDELTTEPITYDEMRPGCFRPVDRLADMDIAGIEAS